MTEEAFRLPATNRERLKTITSLFKSPPTSPSSLTSSNDRRISKVGMIFLLRQAANIAGRIDVPEKVSNIAEPVLSSVQSIEPSHEQQH
jgi:hypothetical protein